MGEEWGSRTPFLYFTDHKAGLASKLAAGRRQEFAHFSAFADPEARACIHDPNDPIIFHHSAPDRCDLDCSEHSDRMGWSCLVPVPGHSQYVPALLGTPTLFRQVQA